MKQEFKAVCYGEVLWDVLPTGAKPGGAPMNVAFHLQKLGMSSALISKVGNDQWGNDLLSILEQYSLSTQYIQIGADYSTGIVNARSREPNEMDYDIIYPVSWDFISINKEFTALVEGAEYFVFGSLAARNDVSRNTLFQLMDGANKKVMDVNLRPPHFEKATIISLLEKADILKLNNHEIKFIAGWFNTYDNIYDQAKTLQDEFDLDTILITLGEKGAIINHNGIFCEHKGYKVRVMDTVGSGDAFLAGYLFQIFNNETPAKALEFGNALGAFIATQSGACPQYNLQEVFQFTKS
jgi:fructokinase